VTQEGSATVRLLPLDSWHGARGARWVDRRGHRIPADYGDAAAEARVVRSACGLLDRSEIARLELIGADRQRFLNGLVTVDVVQLEEGRGIYGFATGPKGQVLSDVVLHCLADRLWLELPPGREGELRRHFEKYVVADRVEVLSLQEMLPLVLIGPGCEAALASCGVAAPRSAWGNIRASLFDSQVQLSRHERLGASAYTVWTPSAIADEIANRLVSELGAVPVGDDAAEALRVEAGIGCWGVDFGADSLAQETGVEAAVDYRKGCYLGQEVVARLHYRGQAPRLLRSLVLPPTPACRPGLEVRFENRAAGRLTSVAFSQRGDRQVGLAMLQRRASEPGTRVELEDGTPAVVRVAGDAVAGGAIEGDAPWGR
jgi:tRNA-modifying protein YgfZ